ncbi:hypothetical protein PSYAE_04380 [Pseudomonas amygdali pv. aesculi str. 0893_23]|nr:hypothetical protein PSYAE_04380 [Pseudomonas amygdali pv. aesculi str. 0893_23]
MQRLLKNTLITNMIRIEGSIRTYGNDFSPSNGFIWQLFIRPQSGDCFSV